MSEDIHSQQGLDKQPTHPSQPQQPQQASIAASGRVDLSYDNCSALDKSAPKTNTAMTVNKDKDKGEAAARPLGCK